MGRRRGTSRLEFLDAIHDDFDGSTSLPRQDGSHRFEVDRNLDTNPATECERRHRHLRYWQAQDLGGLPLHHKRTLRTRPDVEMPIFVPQSRGIVRFNVALMDCGRVELPLKHHIRLTKALGWVTEQE